MHANVGKVTYFSSLLAPERWVVVIRHLLLPFPVSKKMANEASCCRGRICFSKLPTLGTFLNLALSVFTEMQQELREKMAHHGCSHVPVTATVWRDSSVLWFVFSLWQVIFLPAFEGNWRFSVKHFPLTRYGKQNFFYWLVLNKSCYGHSFRFLSFRRCWQATGMTKWYFSPSLLNGLAKAIIFLFLLHYDLADFKSNQ